MERSEFLHTQEKFIEERTRFRDEMLEVNRKLVVERKRLKQDEQFFDKKMEIIEKDFLKKDTWAHKAILNVARIGKFTSDRAVMEYADDIWNIKPC